MHKIFFALLSGLLLTLQAHGINRYDSTSIDIQHYVFALTIHDDTDVIHGKADIMVKLLADQVTDLVLDLTNKKADANGTGMQVSEVTKNGRKLSFTHKNNLLHIALNEQLAKDQIINVEISYSGIPADGLVISENKYGDRTFFGDNWPNRARHWLPTVDHPSDKASCEFMITAPAYYQVIANGILREESNLKAGLMQKETKMTHWVNKEPIPTKVMVFGAARFAVLHAGMSGNIPVEHWVYPEDKDAGFESFEPAMGIIQLFEKHIGAYPYQKLANIESKTNYGGMENASNIFYNEYAIHEQSNIESLMAHEIAHQWFGNAVTEASWPHVWLSEGFATYFTHYYYEQTYGRDSMNARLQADKPPIFAYYLKSPETAIIDTVSANLTTLLNANTYQKGSWFLHMLRYQVGEQAFWQGIRDYYQTYRNSNASTSDFRKVMEKSSGQELAGFFDTWLTKPGHPYLKGSWKYNVFGKKLTIHLDQAQENNVLYDLDLEVAVYYKHEEEPEIKHIRINKKDNEITLKLRKSPREVVLDPNSWLLADYVFEER